MTPDILRDPLKEIPDRWVVRPDYMTVPPEPPAHLVEELVTVIEVAGDCPTAGQMKAMQRLARAIREESRH